MAKFKRKYTLGEEIFNSVSHGIGAGLSIAGTVVLIVTAAIHTNAWGVVSSCIYGASLIILYTMSTLYHSFTNEKVKAFFRIMDHNTIFLLIAGTYTPITLYYLNGVTGWILFGIVWASAIFGIVMNSINLEKARIPSIFCYIGMLGNNLCNKTAYGTYAVNFGNLPHNRRSILHGGDYILRN